MQNPNPNAVPHPGSESAVLRRNVVPTRSIEHEGWFTEVLEGQVAASPEMIFGVISGIGSEHGWYWLWRLRALLDRALGGLSMGERPRDPVHLCQGDVLGCWQVEESRHNRLLRLKSRMKLPGEAWLQIDAVPETQRTTRLRLTARFHTRGLGGRLYWWGLQPVRKLLLHRLRAAICQRAALTATITYFSLLSLAVNS